MLAFPSITLSEISKYQFFVVEYFYNLILKQNIKTRCFSREYFLVEKRMKFSPDVNTFAQVFQYQYQYQYFHSSIFNTNTNTNTLIFRISIPIPIPIPKSIAIPIPIPIVLHSSESNILFLINHVMASFCSLYCIRYTTGTGIKTPWHRRKA